MRNQQVKKGRGHEQALGVHYIIRDTMGPERARIHTSHFKNLHVWEGDGDQGERGQKD
jgi:hypothetical protein